MCCLCVLKGENNKQRSQTVILHKRPVSFYSLSLPVIKCYSVALQATSHGLSHWIQRLGRWCACVCVSVLLVRDGHLSHNNVTHTKRAGEPLASLPSIFSLSHFSVYQSPSEIFLKKKKKKKMLLIIHFSTPLASSLIHPSFTYFPHFCMAAAFFTCISICLCVRAYIRWTESGRDSDDDDCACVKRRLASSGDGCVTIRCDSFQIL